MTTTVRPTKYLHDAATTAGLAVCRALRLDYVSPAPAPCSVYAYGDGCWWFVRWSPKYDNGTTTARAYRTAAEQKLYNSLLRADRTATVSRFDMSARVTTARVMELFDDFTVPYAVA